MKAPGIRLPWMWLLLVASAAPCCPAAPPNVVFILADDLGYGDLGCYGRTDIRTPVLDGLAREGVRFTQYYANGPECTPTRTALMTGRYQQRVGGLECAIGTGNIGRYDDAIRLRESNDLGLPPAENTLVLGLKASGYATAITGKWHLGYEPKFSPKLHGFDRSFYCIGGGMDYFHYLDNLAGYNLLVDGNPVRREGYFTDLLTDQALAFLDEQSRRPFFLHVAFTSPHSPFQGPGDFRDDPLPLDSPLWDQGVAPPDVYIAMIERMDSCIGKVLARLEERGLDGNTVVLFASDNGGTRSARNAPLSGIKGSTMEGGIRVPGIVRWPGVIPAGVTSDQVCATFDFTASILRIAGARPPAGHKLDGLDVLAMLEARKPLLPRTLFWRGRRGEGTWRAVRDGDWKYVSRDDKGNKQEYLFDLARDLPEKENLLPTNPDDADRLRRLLVLWEREVAPTR
ncbi:MAG: sulfatase-like hydrolase/transferase [Thermoguttaceae bacterium]